MFKKQLLAAMALGVSMSAQAANFSLADAKFARRDTSRSTTLEARAAYKAILDQGVTGLERVRAGEGYLRTYLYEGTHYAALDNKAERAAIFHQCWNVASQTLSPATLGYAFPGYYYFRAACMFYEAQASTFYERLGMLSSIYEAIKTGLEAPGGDIYEGGGLLRVRAAVMSDPDHKGVPGVYNPQQALILIDQALDSDPYPDINGFLFCENYRRKIGIQVELGSKVAAKALADQTIADFTAYLDDGLLPEFIRSETADCISKLIVETSASRNYLDLIVLDLSNQSQNYKYRVSVSRPVIPKQTTGNPLRDSYLQVSCGEIMLGRDSRRMSPTDFGRLMTFQVTFDLTNQICPKFMLRAVLETNGTFVEVPSIQYDISKVRETIPYFISHVRKDMPTYKQDVVYYHGEMSKALGNRVSLHCLIKGYENDPIFADIIIPDLVAQYKNLFGVEYKSGDIVCTSPPKLDNEISECTTHPNLRRNFCTNYKLYASSLKWFGEAIEAALDQKQNILAGEEALVFDLDQLMRELEKADTEAKTQTAKKS